MQMQVYFTKHAHSRCKERNLNQEYLRKVIQEAPKCVGEMRLKVDDNDTYAVIHDINNIRYVITIYKRGIDYEDFNPRSKRKLRRERGRRNNGMGSFREW